MCAGKKMREELGFDHDVFFDVWYMDDGQIVLDPRHVDLFLKTFDAELLRIGATRGERKADGSDDATVESGGVDVKAMRASLAVTRKFLADSWTQFIEDVPGA